MDRRSDIKRQYDAYREKAKDIVAATGWSDVSYNPTLSVDQHAHVQLCEDGAFVECLVWVPKELLS